MPQGDNTPKHDIAPTIRGTFMEGLRKICRKRGILLSDYFAEWIEEDGLTVTLPILSRFTPTESKLDANVNHSGLVGVLSGLAPVIEEHIVNTLEQDNDEDEQILTISTDSKTSIESS